MIKKIIDRLSGRRPNETIPSQELLLLQMGKLLTNQQALINSDNIQDYEFKVFSQFGDDGIIQHLIRQVPIKNQTFIEFGVGDYSESNTKFLLWNNNWSGYVLDGSAKNIARLRASRWLWLYDLRSEARFIDKNNINGLLKKANFKDVGLLHIDLDGNDYWVWEALDLSALNPSIVVLEYNSVFGSDRAITVPYQKDFFRTARHHSNLFWGASLKALVLLSEKKGYAFVGCNSAGNNAYFVKKDQLGKLKRVSVKAGFAESKFRESRDQKENLSYLRGAERLQAIKGLRVINVSSGKAEKL